METSERLVLPEVRCDGEDVTLKKGGGRESGGPYAHGKVSAEPVNSAGDAQTTAANPAAHYGEDPMQECECFLHRRIRALEARVERILVTAEGSPAEASAIRWLREEVAKKEAPAMTLKKGGEREALKEGLA